MNLKKYFRSLSVLPMRTTVDIGGNQFDLIIAINRVIHIFRNNGNIFVIGNGGSASIASHCASHYPRAKGLRIFPLNDISAMTATANDFGYEQVYAKQISVMADSGDVVVAISSSGKSPNILNACDIAKEKGCIVITFSGFAEDNPLRNKGYINFHVPSHEYGLVECTHMALLHAIFDMMGEV